LKNGEEWNESFIKKSLKSAYAINTIKKEVEAGEKQLIEMGYGHVALSDDRVGELTELMGSPS
jgi:hypothetical protein